MKLTADYDQLELAHLLSGVEARLTVMSVERHNLQREVGRGHTNTILAGRAVAMLQSLRDKLQADIDQAKRSPAASHGTYEGSLQVGDELPIVYGRPRASRAGERR